MEYKSSQYVKNVKVYNADHVKTKIILGQGQSRPIRQAHNTANVKSKGNVISENSRKTKVTLAQGHDQRVEVPSQAFYNKHHTPAQIESLLVCPLRHNVNIFKANAQRIVARSYASVVKGKTKEQLDGKQYCRGGVFWASSGKLSEQQPVMKHNPRPCKGITEGEAMTRGGQVSPLQYSNNGEAINVEQTHSNALQNQSKLNVGVVEMASLVSRDSDNNKSVNTDPIHGQRLLFDIRNTEGDKFVNSIIFNDNRKLVAPVECKAYDQWRVQSKVNIGFIPLTDPVLPSTERISDIRFSDPSKLHEEVKKYNLPNYLGARIPVKSQMNIQAWKVLLRDYWDQQLLQCLEFGFPLGFNRMCPLKHDKANHKSALEFPQDVEKYIEEEKSFGAIIGPFKEAPIPNLHYSPFMTRHKPNSDTRRVILDLSWPRAESVNAGVEKDGYLGSDFKLTFSTIDDLTRELVKIGKGAHIFKVDVSRAFRHLNVDPRDYDLLGVNWDATYIDTRIPFGSRHGSQFFQRASDAVRHVIRQRDINVINYIDDFLGYGTPGVARRSYDALLDVMAQLGVTVSKKKLVASTTKAVCLGILIDTVEGTVAIPPEKLQDIKNMVKEWKNKQCCTKRQLQSSLQGVFLTECWKRYVMQTTQQKLSYQMTFTETERLV